MSEQYIAIIRVETRDTCCLTASTHIFSEESEEELQKALEKQLLIWLEDSRNTVSLDKEEQAEYEAAVSALKEFAGPDGERSVEVSFEDSIYTYVNRFDEFTCVWDELQAD